MVSTSELHSPVVTHPRLLLLDEPFSSLDPELRTTLRAELIALQRSLGPTMIYVTHHPDDARALADRLVSMRDGRIEQDADGDRSIASR